jgi:hypothetical protein
VSNVAWERYVAALEGLSAADAKRASKADRIAAAFSTAGTRLQNEQRDAAQGLAQLRQRADAFAARARRFAAEVGVAAPPAGEHAPIELARIAALLDEQERRLTKAESSRDWIARFQRSEADRAAERQRELDRLAEEARRAAAPAPRGPAVEPSQGRGTSRTRVLVIAGVGVVLLLVGVVVTVVVLGQ